MQKASVASEMRVTAKLASFRPLFYFPERVRIATRNALAAQLAMAGLLEWGSDLRNPRFNPGLTALVLKRGGRYSFALF